MQSPADADLDLPVLTPGAAGPGSPPRCCSPASASGTCWSAPGREADAEAAEDDALVAPGFASGAIELAEVAVLNAVDARTWADGRAAFSQTS
jgi:hypothetical protein